MSALTGIGLGYQIGSAVLVTDVDLRVEPGELVGVIGPNGAGKSTLLRLLAGELHPTRGAVTIDGADLASLSPDRLALLRAVFSPEAAQDVPFTTGAVVHMGRFPHRRDVDNSRLMDAAAVEAALERTDTSHLIERVFATLSSGERTRVTFARVLAQDAPVLLLDEPTTALDVGHEEMVLGVIRDLVNQGRAVVAVLHDLNAAAHYADRLVLMAGGEVLATGTPREVLTEPVLREVYGQAVRVVDHPFRDCPLVLTAD